MKQTKIQLVSILMELLGVDDSSSEGKLLARKLFHQNSLDDLHRRIDDIRQQRRSDETTED